jgi:hypothetical protein
VDWLRSIARRWLASAAATAGPRRDAPLPPLHQELLSTARGLLERQQYRGAVVIAQTACEVLTAQVIRHLLNTRRAGDLEEWVADSLPSFSLDDRAVRDLYATLSGDRIQERSLWPRYTGHVRHENRVVRRGEAATREQAEDSCAAAAELLEYLESMLKRPQ